MGLTPDALRRLSELLDEGATQPPAQFRDWLDHLPDSDQGLRDALERMLQRKEGVETDELIDRLPAFQLPAEAAETADYKAGDVVGAYRLERALGQGGMGEVWLAHRADGQMLRKVALKLPLLSGPRKVLVQRFARERDILGALVHPHIARLYDAGMTAEGQPYLALEYVEGLPITEFCAKNDIDVKGRVELMIQVAKATQYAHSNLVIHRDLKPGNVLVDAQGQAMLLDFGIAKLTEHERGEAAETELTRLGGRALTPAYAAPEQLRGDAVSTATDVYALGVLLYELLSGRRPFDGNRTEVEQAVLGTDPPRLRNVPADLATVVFKALKKLPGERYPTADALVADLTRWRNDEAVLASPEGNWYRARKFVRRNRLAVASSATVAVAVSVAAAVSVWQAQIARDEARRAEQEARRATAVQDFMKGLFRANASRQKDPAKARATTARELLDMGAEQLKDALKDSPEARADAMVMLSEMYYELELLDKAAELDTQRVELLRSTLGNNHVRVANALILLAGSLHATSRRDEIMPALQEAKRIFDSRPDKGGSHRGELLVRLAQRSYNLSLSDAKRYATEAIDWLGREPQIDHDMLSTAFALRGRTLAALGELRDARASYERALSELALLPTRPHADVMEARLSLAEVLAARQEWRAALPIAAQAVREGEAALGNEAPGVILGRARWATLLHATGERQRSRQLLRDAYERMLRVKGPNDTLYTSSARSHLGRSLLAEGRIAESESLLNKVVESNRRHYRGSGVLSSGFLTLARIQGAKGEFKTARELVREANEIRRQGAMRDIQPWRANRHLLEAARLDLWEGQPANAVQLLQEYVAWPESELVQPRLEEIERDTLLGSALLSSGDVDGGLKTLRQAHAALEKLQGAEAQPAAEADVSLALGEALLNKRDIEAAGRLIERAVLLRRQLDAPSSPWLAQAEAVRGLWLVQAGQISAARDAEHVVAAAINSGGPFNATLTKDATDLRGLLEWIRVTKPASRLR